MSTFPRVVARYKYAPHKLRGMLVHTHVLDATFSPRPFHDWAYFEDENGEVPKHDMVAVETSETSWHFKASQEHAEQLELF